MPVRQLNPFASAEHEELVRALADEWETPDSSAVEPIIFEDHDRQGMVAQVYVAWDRWADVDRSERSEIIMEAAERRLDAERLLRISVAMGLTLDEARRTGILEPKPARA